MQAKLTIILERKVNLVVVRANHLTTQEVTIVLGTLVEIGLSQIIIAGITTGWSVHMHTATITVAHFIEVIFRTILVGLACTDTLGIREADLQTLQNLAPSKVIRDTSING